MKKILMTIILGFTLLSFTACNDDNASSKKCSGDEKCQSGKCDSSKKQKKEEPAKKCSSENKCGEGKCG